MLTDQYECRIKEWLPYTKGKEEPYKIYCGGIVFIDHNSGHVSIYNQVSLGAADTVLSKEIYEGEADDLGITIEQYHGDNRVYTSKMFTDDLEKKTLGYVLFRIRDTRSEWSGGKSNLNHSNICKNNDAISSIDVASTL